MEKESGGAEGRKKGARTEENEEKGMRIRAIHFTGDAFRFIFFNRLFMTSTIHSLSIKYARRPCIFLKKRWFESLGPAPPSFIESHPP